MKREYLPNTYENFSLIMPIEEHGYLIGILILAWLPLLAFSASFIMLRNKNKRLSYALFTSFLLFTAITITTHRFSLFKSNLIAFIMLLVVFVYWLVLVIKKRR